MPARTYDFFLFINFYKYENYKKRKVAEKKQDSQIILFNKLEE